MTQWICLAILKPNSAGVCHGAIVRTSVDDLNDIEGLDSIRKVMDENPEFQDTRTCKDLIERKEWFDILYAEPGTKFTREGVRQCFKSKYGRRLNIELTPMSYKEA